jgi:hypothetical protein
MSQGPLQRYTLLMLGAAASAVLPSSAGAGRPGKESPPPVVEVEEQVYVFGDANNGAGPLWASGSSCVARVGEEVFISGLEVLPGVPPLNNVRWQLYQRKPDGWQVVAKGDGRTREPCPLASFPTGPLFLSDNPTLTEPSATNGPARPEVLAFDPSHPTAPPKRVVPVWSGAPEFTEHSYRSFAADGENGELIVFQNVGYDRVEWSFRDRSGAWSAQGALGWPWGAEYPKPEPIRVCYPAVAVKGRKVYFCGVSDIVEPYPEWRAAKREITGRDWDYDFRRLFFTWSDDIATGRFHPWVEVASRDKTCGWIMPCDLWVGPDGTVHLLWTERAIDTRLRERFFPEAKQSVALMYATVREGRVVSKRPIEMVTEGTTGPEPGRGRFHVTADGRLLVLYYVGGTGVDGQRIAENRLVEVRKDGTTGAPQRVGLARPFTNFYTATWRAGTRPSDVIDVYGTRAGDSNSLWYARIRAR